MLVLAKPVVMMIPFLSHHPSTHQLRTYLVLKLNDNDIIRHRPCLSRLCDVPYESIEISEGSSLDSTEH